MRYFLAFVLLVLGPASLAAAAPGWTIEMVALEGEPAPGTGRNYQVLDPGRDAGANTAFSGWLDGTPPLWGTFQRSNGTVALVALSGDAAPGTASTYTAVINYNSVAPGRLTVVGILASGDRGVFRYSGATQEAVVLTGDAAPGGGSFDPGTGDIVVHSMNVHGEIGFRSSLSGGAGALGVFVTDGSEPTGFRAIALEGQPAAGGGTWTAFGWPSLGDAGDVVFGAEIAAGAAASGLFLDTAGGLTTLALQGGGAPGTGGATFDSFHYPVVNGAGEVVFLAGVSGATSDGGLFLVDSGGLSALLVANQVLPGTGGRTIAQFGPTLPTLNENGSSAFSAVLSGEPESSGLFLSDGTTGAIGLVALSGEPAPGAGDATFTGFEYTGLDDDDIVSFRAKLSDDRTGIFVATPALLPAAVPTLSPAAGAVLSLLLAAAGGLVLRSRAREPRPGQTSHADQAGGRTP